MGSSGTGQERDSDGKQCKVCLPLHYGFSQEGCKLCACDPSGSTEQQCDLLTGQCPCRDKVEGRKCDRCMENTRSRDTGGYGDKICEPCDDCYNLVQDAADEHRQNLANLDALLQKIAENPEPVGNDFEYEMTALNVKVKSLLADTRLASRSEDGDTLRDRLQNLRTRLQDVVELIVDADGNIAVAKEQGQEVKRDVSRVKVVIQEARTALKVSQNDALSFAHKLIGCPSTERPTTIGDAGPGSSAKGRGEVQEVRRPERPNVRDSEGGEDAGGAAGGGRQRDLQHSQASVRHQFRGVRDGQGGDGAAAAHRPKGTGFHIAVTRTAYTADKPFI